METGSPLVFKLDTTCAVTKAVVATQDAPIMSGV